MSQDPKPRSYKYVDINFTIICVSCEPEYRREQWSLWSPECS